MSNIANHSDSFSEIDVSFVIPCYKSEDTVSGVIDEIIRTMSHVRRTYEIVAVVDGSPDNVFNVLLQLAKNLDNLKVVDLARNYGQSNALMAGFRAALGNYTVCLDDDGQCPVDQVELLLKTLDDGADVAMAHFQKKKQSRFKNFGSYINEVMIHRVIGSPANFQISNFMAFNCVVKRRLINYRGPYPYLAGLILSGSVRISNVELQQRKRQHGTSTYTFKKMLSLWISGFTGFSLKPLHALAYLGLAQVAIAVVVGFIGFISLVKANFFYQTILIAVILLASGSILIGMALLGEYVGRTLLTLSGIPQYSIRCFVNVSEDKQQEFVVSTTSSWFTSDKKS